MRRTGRTKCEGDAKLRRGGGADKGSGAQGGARRVSAAGKARRPAVSRYHCRTVRSRLRLGGRPAGRPSAPGSASLLPLGGAHLSQVHHTLGVAPLVVVPGHNLNVVGGRVGRVSRVAARCRAARRRHMRRKHNCASGRHASRPGVHPSGKPAVQGAGSPCHSKALFPLKHPSQYNGNKLQASIQ